MSLLETGLTLAEAKRETLDIRRVASYVPAIYGNYDARDHLQVAPSLDVPREQQDFEKQASEEVVREQIDYCLSIDLEELESLRPSIIPPTTRLAERVRPSPLIEQVSLDDASATIILSLLDMEEYSRSNAYPEVLICSTLVELGLSRCLAERMKSVIDEIAVAQKTKNKRYQTETMVKWAEGKVETSLGIVIMLLCGIRWALQRGSSIISEFLHQHFQSEFLDIVNDSRLTKSLEIIRNDYRNPAHHGRRVDYARSDYEALARLATGFNTVSSWMKCNPSPVSPDIGVLHNHLVLVLKPMESSLGFLNLRL